jgi:regulator of sigma E protease
MSLAMVGQFVLSLSILIVLHECGHFFPAKWFKTRVEKFYLFFDPYFALFKTKIGETEYGIGWLPLGGYVKISGMIDESMDTEQMKQPAQPWEFRSKPAWQRLIIMLGGVTVNFILGFFILGMMLWHYGEEYLPAKNAPQGIYADSLGLQLGLRTGDNILKVGDKPFDRFSDREVLRGIIFNNAKTITVERAGATLDLPVPADAVKMLTKNSNKDKGLFMPRFPFVVGTIQAGSPAQKIGLKAEDKVIAINDSSVRYYDEFKTQIKPYVSKEIVLTILRGADTVKVTVTTNKDATIGVVPKSMFAFFDTEKQTYSLTEAIPKGINRGMDFLGNQVSAFGKMFSGDIKASESMGGFASIAEMYGKVWDWERFWQMTATLSLILAFMNLLPIPALDGGHVMFLLWEVVTGKKPSDLFMERATMVGFALILSLLLYANGMDVIRRIF